MVFKPIKIDPKNVDAHFYLTHSKYCLNDFKGSIKDVNKAIKICNSNYILRVDSDDYVEKNFLKLTKIARCIK